MKPWSHSLLTAYETCPRQFDILRNKKLVQQGDTEATLWGKIVHKHLEDRMRDGTPLPDSLAYLNPLVSRIASWQGEQLIEAQMAVSYALEPADWWGCWARGVVDYGVIGGSKAVLLDWKTGKRKPGSDQLKLFAAFGFSHYPELQKVTTGFVWLKENKLDKEVYTREQAPGIWQEFAPRVRRLELAYEKDAWPARPSGLCGWCPVGRSNCQFWKERRVK